MCREGLGKGTIGLLSFEWGFYKLIYLQNITPVWGNFTCGLLCHLRCIAKHADFWGKTGEFRHYSLLPKNKGRGLRGGVTECGSWKCFPGQGCCRRSSLPSADLLSSMWWLFYIISRSLWLWGIIEVAEGKGRAASLFSVCRFCIPGGGVCIQKSKTKLYFPYVNIM